MTVDDVRRIDLPRIADARGALSVVEAERHVPFPIRRVFYVYDLAPGAERGAHAHRELHQFLVCLHGAVDVRVDDGARHVVHRLEHPWEGLHIPPMIWASEANFADGTVFMVLASDVYKADDYLRDYDEFLKAVRR